MWPKLQSNIFSWYQLKSIIWLQMTSNIAHLCYFYGVLPFKTWQPLDPIHFHCVEANNSDKLPNISFLEKECQTGLKRNGGNYTFWVNYHFKCWLSAVCINHTETVCGLTSVNPSHWWYHYRWLVKTGGCFHSKNAFCVRLILCLFKYGLATVLIVMY